MPLLRTALATGQALTATQARVVQSVVRSALQALGLLIVVLVFVPVALALPLWPLLPRDRVMGLLELYKGWTLSILGAPLPESPPADDEDPPPPALRVLPLP